jgi:glutamate synthase (NADPH/NADH) small chain
VVSTGRWSCITERAFAEGIQPPPPRRETGAGGRDRLRSGRLAAAQALRRQGTPCPCLKKADRIGASCAIGIPDFKLDKSVLERRLRWPAKG